MKEIMDTPPTLHATSPDVRVDGAVLAASTPEGLALRQGVADYIGHGLVFRQLDLNHLGFDKPAPKPEVHGLSRVLRALRRG